MDGETEELGLTLADGDRLGETEELGDKLGLTEKDGDKLGLTEELGDKLGLSEELGDKLGLSEELGLTLAEGDKLGETDADGDKLLDGDKLPDGDKDGLTLELPVFLPLMIGIMRPVLVLSQYRPAYTTQIFPPLSLMFILVRSPGVAIPVERRPCYPE